MNNIKCFNCDSDIGPIKIQGINNFYYRYKCGYCASFIIDLNDLNLCEDIFYYNNFEYRIRFDFQFGNLYKENEILFKIETMPTFEKAKQIFKNFKENLIFM